MSISVARVPEPAARAAVQLPGSCGELFQGTLDGEPCLVSCPIGRFGSVEIEFHDGPGWEAPSDSPKALAAIRAGSSHLGCLRGGQLRLSAELPRGRGYGSSTADVGASLFGLAKLWDVELSPVEIAALATRVEPSDSTLFPGLALFAHQSGRRIESLGPAPRLDALVLDPGGYIDTLRFNAADHRDALRRLEADHAEAFAILRRSLVERDYAALGHAATLSAQAHQAVLPDALGAAVGALARDAGALGVCRAHSGTLWGVLVHPAQSDVRAIEKYMRRRLPPGVSMRCETLVDGGPRYLAP